MPFSGTLLSLSSLDLIPSFFLFASPLRLLTTMAHEDASQPAKRIKLTSPDPDKLEKPPTAPSASRLASLHRPISPPLPASSSPSARLPNPKQSPILGSIKPRILSSPFQLTHIRDLASSSGNNVDTIRLRDLLGDPMIRECWQFNYFFDVDFLMSQFDEDVRALVDVKLVHGSWKKEAPNRLRIDVSPLCDPFACQLSCGYADYLGK